MDDNTFFRKATLSICGNLKIEEALFETVKILQQVMPADRIFLQKFDFGYGAMRSIAMATAEEFHRLDILIPLSEEARDLEKLKDVMMAFEIYVYNDPEKYAIVREIHHHLRMSGQALMVMVLRSGKQHLGSLAIISHTSSKFTEEHVRLIEMLKKPFAVALSNTLALGEVVHLKDLLADDNRYLQGELRRISGNEIVGSHFGLKGVMKSVQQVAALDSPVLLLGETGTGKDVIANAIHSLSSRNNGPFINVNCGAIPETLIDSELFGHEKGAFTGALGQKRGRFERADKGTIFLDEIGELPLPAQVRLLKVLQSREIERVGGTKTITLNIRIVAATNRDLEQMVKDGRFREDLWYRLNVFPIRIPPLRERLSDIPAIVQHFIHLKTKELKLPDIPVLSPGALDPLMAYHWPGNVRELQNVVERELIVNPAGPLSFSHFISPQSGQVDAVVQNITPDNLDQAVSQHIRQVLAKAGGKIHGDGGAAELLGINPSTLRNRMNKLGIDYKRG